LAGGSDILDAVPLGYPVLGSPRECRERAARCEELALSARSPQLQAALLGLSATWQKLAHDLEVTAELLAAETLDNA